MKRKTIIIIGLCLAIVSFLLVLLCGKTYTINVNVPVSLTDVESINVKIESSERNIDVSPSDILQVEQKKLNNGRFSLKLRAVGTGKVYIDVTKGDDYYLTDAFYVHPTGYITSNSFFGKSNGDIVIPLAAALFLAVVLYAIIQEFKANVRHSFYQYRNVTYLALILFTSFLILHQLAIAFNYRGLIHTVRTVLETAGMVVTFALPLILIVSVYVTVSNIKLMRKEGRNWRNMLGCILGILVIAATILPYVVSYMLQLSTIVDVHNEQGSALYIEEAFSASFSMAIAYLECVLVGTIVFAVKAARHIPTFDKDYILILGCQIRKDGTLTKLLQSRADRAVEFARMQREATGKEITFVPSGGQGSDEVMPEAQAIKNYLLGIGIPDERILPEDKSVNTFENLKNSMGIIKEHSDASQPKVAFSTTNYHVFRAGMFAAQQGFDMDGIGSPTKSYFWINAFIREFIATLVSERKTHVITMAILSVAMIIMVMIRYLSNIL